MDAIQGNATDKPPTRDSAQATVGDDSPLKPAAISDRLAVRKQKIRKKRRRLTLAVIVTLLLAVGGYLLWAMLATRSRARINLTVRPRSDQTAEQSATVTSPEDITNQALAEVRGDLRQSTQAGEQIPGADKNSAPKAQQSDTELPTDDSGSAESQIPPPVNFQRNAERSIRFLPPEPPAGRANTTDAAVDRDRRPNPSLVSLTSQPSLPPYGSLLPVRSLGIIFTMRSGTARLELSRDIRGDGWSLSKGTVLICNLNGSERDRALLSLVGFINPETNQLVRLTGEMLGSDGGAGLKGKQHKLSNGWSRAFSKIGSTAINVAGAIAAGRISGQPVIVTDLGSRAVNPVTREADDLIFDRSDGRSFVEVPAQSPGYILVTQLPTTDTTARDASRQLAQADGPLTDEELADILTSNDRGRIQAALPRMTPQMRRLAEAMLQEN